MKLTIELGGWENSKLKEMTPMDILESERKKDWELVGLEEEYTNLSATMEGEIDELAPEGIYLSDGRVLEIKATKEEIQKLIIYLTELL